MANKFSSCYACGNRYPKNEGFGHLQEFCSAGCCENWWKTHPNYYKNTKRRGRFRNLWTLIKLAFFIFVVIYVIKNVFFH